MERRDIIIIGAGPAGLMAAVYAARYKLDALVFGILPGGLISEAYEVCNFPSYGKINGLELAMKMLEQAKKLGVEIREEEVIFIKKDNNGFIVKTANKEYFARKIILAIGTKRRKLNVQGEKEFLGRGVSYCATCDAAFFRNKTTAVVGGSDAALTAALLLSEYSDKVYIIYRKDRFFRAEPAWIELVEKRSNIKPIFNSEISEIYGNQMVEGVKLKDGRKIAVDGVFVEIGSEPDETLTSQLGLERERGYIVVNRRQETSIKGIFAAGDITNNTLKQAVTAASEGAVAAHSAYEEIKKGD